MYPIEGTHEEYTGDGAKLSLKQEKEAPNLRSHNYIFFGHVDVVMRAAPGSGIVSGIVLQSDDLDEIDLEWVGRDNGHAQSNWFHLGAGPDEKYDRGATHDVADVTGTFHTYSFDWTPERLQWLIDGKPVRTVTVADAKGKFPTSPCYLRIGLYSAGAPDALKGVKEWAGETDMSKAPFDVVVKSVKLVDYAGGATAATKDVKEYSYGDNSGKAESIQFHPEGSGNTGSKGESDASSSPAPASSSSAAPKESSSASKTDVPSSMTTSSVGPKSSDASQTSGAASKSSGAATTSASSKPDSAGNKASAAGPMAIMGAAAGVFAWLAL